MIWRILSNLILIVLLTIITQTGGLVLILCIPFFYLTRNKFSNLWKKFAFKLASYTVAYSICTVLIVPFVAKQFGKVQLPLFETSHFRPANSLTYFLNRNYVRSELKTALESVAKEMNKKYPGTTINYLDANFPFINKFPLLPHRSHNDGRKLDVSFSYKTKSGERSNEVPSFIGYGVCEEPQPNEYNMPSICAAKGYWQYSALKKIVSQKKNGELLFDAERTRSLVNFFAEQEVIGWMFIEPHLKTRLGLTSSKVAFHGCQAVRHDDHLHVQLK